ncbi:hypothetical protein CHUAL_014216 [Chamberlinius hualienensis]
MNSTKVRGNKKPKKKVVMTIELKKEIVAKHENGLRVVELSKQYGKSVSTISTIIKKREAIKKANVAKGVTVLTKQRSRGIDEVEKLLINWINDKQLARESVSEAMICQKARLLYAEVIEKTPHTCDTTVVSFKASRGWFDNFKKRSGIRSVAWKKEAGSSVDDPTDEPIIAEFKTFVGEAFISVEDQVERCVAEFKTFVENEGYQPQQVFNCNVTGLFWKRMPKRTYITQEEKALPGHKPMKDRINLLLCSNATGDLKIKPLLVYHSENPRAFKKYHVQKNTLSVMWRSNRKALVTRQFFIEWVNTVLGPSVKKYLQERGLPLKALLVLNNSPAHPPGILQALLEEFSFITFKFLPPNLTSQLQPMDQRVISIFKKFYTKVLFQRCCEVTSDTELTLRQFWKEHYNILNCLSLVDKAWGEIPQKTLNYAWEKLWPDSVLKWEFEPDPAVYVVKEIVSMAKEMGLDVNSDDVEELMVEHCGELTAEELLDLYVEQEQQTAEEVSSGVEEASEDVPPKLIKEMCGVWAELQSFVEKCHPDKAAAWRAINIFNDDVMSHFRQLVKRRQKQLNTACAGYNFL